MPDNLTPPIGAGQIVNAPAVARILSRCDRQKLDNFIEVALELIDVADGDPDLEPDGDDLDGAHAEDEEGNHLGLHGIGPGCPIADPGEYSIPERHGKQPEPNQSPRPEDDEDDDPAEEDDPSDTGNAEDEAITGELGLFATRHAGPGCSLSDPGGCEHDGREPEFGV